MDKNFIIENHVLKAYIGDNSVSEIIIPEGVKELEDDIFQERMIAKKLTIKIPASLKKVNKNAFNTGVEIEFVYSKKSQVVTSGGIDYIKLNDDFNNILKEGNYSREFLNIPSGVSELYYFISAKIVLIPKTLKPSSFTRINADFYLFEHPVLNCKWIPSKSLYVFENIKHDSVEYVNALKEKGYDYIKTNKGLIVTEFDINVAKFQEIPKTLEGQKVLSFHNVDMFKDYGKVETEFREDNTKLKEELKNLYPVFKYQKKQLHDKLRETIADEKERLNGQRKKRTVDDPCSEETFVGDVSSGHKVPIALLLALAITGVVLYFTINMGAQVGTLILSSLAVFFGSWVFFGLFKMGILNAIDKARTEKKQRQGIPAVTYSFRSSYHDKLQKDFPEGLYLRAILIYDSEIENLAKEVKKASEEYFKYMDSIDTSGRSYKIYDNSGNEIGRIDEK